MAPSRAPLSRRPYLEMLASFLLAAVLQTKPDLRLAFAGNGYLFRMERPAGWVVDAKAAKDAGALAVLVPEAKPDGRKLTLRVDPKAEALKNPFERVIDDRLEAMKKDTIGSKAKAGPELKSVGGHRAFAFFVDPPPNQGVRRTIVFYDSPRVVVSIVLEAPDEIAYNDAVPAFAEFVKSYGFITARVGDRGNLLPAGR